MDQLNRGSYEKITPAKKAKIARYAAENGIVAAFDILRLKKNIPKAT